MSCDKEEYSTRQLAVEAARQISKRDNVSLHVYKCHEGNHYHLATNGKRRKLKTVYPKPQTKFTFNYNAKKYTPKQTGFERATYKLLSKEMAAYLRRLIEGRRYLEQQKLINGN